MEAYLLDTSVIIDYLRGKEQTLQFIRELFHVGSSLGCCAINITEVHAGMLEKERRTTEEFLESLEYYAISRQAAKEAGEYKRQYAKRGVVLSVPDVTVAAVAVENRLALITGNPKHYPMPELKVITHKAV